MKKTSTVLSFIFLSGFLIVTLFTFNIPPFDAATISKIFQSQKTSEETDQPQVLENLNFQEHITQGENLETENFPDLALVEYESAKAQNPDSPIPYLKIANLQLKRQQKTAAENILLEAINRQITSPEILSALAKTYLASGKFQKLADFIEQYSRTDTPELKYYRSILYISQKDFAAAKSLLQELAENPNLELKSKAQNYLNSFKEFEAFQAGENEHLETLLARAMIESEEYPGAISLLFDVIRQKNDYRDAWILLGYAYLKNNQAQEAIDALNEAKKLDSQKPEIAFYLGLAYLQQNQLQQAANNIENAINNGYEPVNQAKQKLAEIYFLQENYQSSIQNYEQLIRNSNPEVAFYVRPMWMYIEKLNQPEKALAMAEKVLSQYPTEAMSFNLLAWAQMASGQYQIAESNLQIALSLNPNLEAAYYNLGQIYEKQQNFPKAKENYQTAYNLGKSNQIAQESRKRFNQILQLEQGQFTADLTSPQ